MLKTIVKSLANPLGIDVVKFPPVSPLARLLRDFFQRTDINLVLDIGACDGDFARFLRKHVGYTGKIISFEPTRSTFAALSNRMSHDRNWSGFNFGLSDTNGIASLNTYGERRDFNSILELKEKDAASHGVDMTARSAERIEIRTLDAIWGGLVEGIEVPRIHLKIDTQGHDPAVVRGATGHITDVVGLQSEVPAIQIYEGMQPMHEIIRTLSDLGFTPMGFHPINHPEDYDGMSPEFDVVFRRRDRAI